MGDFCNDCCETRCDCMESRCCNDCGSSCSNSFGIILILILLLCLCNNNDRNGGLFGGLL